MHNAIINSLTKVVDNQWTNPFYRPPTPLIKHFYLPPGLHAGTNFLGRTNEIKNPTLKTTAKILAFIGDLFTAIICNPVAILFDVSIAAIGNRFINWKNHAIEKRDQKARKSWTPTSYRAIGVDIALVALVALGSKHLFLANKQLLLPAETAKTRQPLPEAQRSHVCNIATPLPTKILYGIVGIVGTNTALRTINRINKKGRAGKIAKVVADWFIATPLCCVFGTAGMPFYFVYRAYCWTTGKKPRPLTSTTKPV